MASHSDIVDRFIAAWARKDVDQIMSFFTPDAVYINVPIEPPNVGQEMIRKTIEGFVGMAEAVEFRVHHQGESPSGVVLNERTDRFKINGRWVEAGVMGVFEFDGDRIKAWRDYFDMAQFTKAMSGGA
ncbi:MAG: limonene-1,2-epoxide hydrolase family protein [Myxococcota bacterium]